MFQCDLPLNLVNASWMCGISRVCWHPGLLYMDTNWRQKNICLSVGRLQSKDEYCELICVYKLCVQRDIHVISNFIVYRNITPTFTPQWHKIVYNSKSSIVFQSYSFFLIILFKLSHLSSIFMCSSKLFLKATIHPIHSIHLQPCYNEQLTKLIEYKSKIALY